jgi:aspartate carbamoyltransferase catalytic subunit
MSYHQILRSQQFERADIELICEDSEQMRKIDGKACDLLKGKILYWLSLEESTRTRGAAQGAIMRLGGNSIATTDPTMSSMAKGESFEHTIRVISDQCHVLVLRTKEEGQVAIAAQHARSHLINAGDGPGQHPTQALTDIFTMRDIFGQIDGKKIALAGDLKYGRTHRSLAYMLSKFDIEKLFLVAPDVVQMKPDILEHLDEAGVNYELTDDLRAVAPQVDVINMSRIQKARFGECPEDYERACGQVVINQELLDIMREDTIIMHPLPIDSKEGREITPEVDNDCRARYFDQSKNKVYVMMAILCQIFKSDI